ncbi:unnamed protein product [Bursaphelenchus xylophilus]|uniref:(pine wood nematode) hypothetical protein n=1 Tax=Bursaphelenchus xylophilus TaxID=6326 RepID=A0A1I7RSN6_BURXY|nr:unnamed protein product [Bursaphelenchus xylophilus]CAG9122857.1 unnamed protein product [Bursaphelenchus xylophilus]
MGRFICILILTSIFVTNCFGVRFKRSVYQQAPGGQGHYVEPPYPYKPAPIGPDNYVQPSGYYPQPSIGPPVPVYPIAPGYALCEECVLSWNSVIGWLRDGGGTSLLVIVIVLLIMVCVICCLACAAAGALGASRVNAQDSQPPADHQTPPKK